ncbi:venom allergen 5-like protein [Aphelenchoides avenae]|nr:venom allergen 5-like protein [Aphelenchus avenae]
MQLLPSISHTVTSGQLTEQEAQFVTDRHNEKRALPFKDGTTYGGNMRRLNWDSEIAAIAQSWADELCARNRMEHDDDETRCIIVDGEQICGIGQNLATGSTTSENRLAPTLLLNKSVEMWYGEIADANLADLNPLNFKDETGHYTQVVWADSARVGCGACTLPQNANGFCKWYIACDYYPAGNYNGENTFTVSDALGTDCPEGTTADSDGLCDGPFSYPSQGTK